MKDPKSKSGGQQVKLTAEFVTVSPTPQILRPCEPGPVLGVSPTLSQEPAITK